jgi:hypothetical protein
VLPGFRRRCNAISKAQRRVGIDAGVAEEENMPRLLVVVGRSVGLHAILPVHRPHFLPRLADHYPSRAARRVMRCTAPSGLQPPQYDPIYGAHNPITNERFDRCQEPQADRLKVSLP